MSPGIPVLTTPRLVLRPVEIAHAPAIQRIFPQWEIAKYLAAKVPWPYPEDEARLAAVAPNARLTPRSAVPHILAHADCCPPGCCRLGEPVWRPRTKTIHAVGR